MDALYGLVPHLMRGRVISRNELFFQLANVTGAALAVLVYPGPSVGFAAVAVMLILVGVTYVSQLRLSLRNEAGRWLLGQRPRVGTDALPLALLAEAMRFAEQGDHYVAIVVADSAVRVLDARVPASPESAGAPGVGCRRSDHRSPSSPGTLEPTNEDSMAVINAAARTDRRTLTPRRESGAAGAATADCTG